MVKLKNEIARDLGICCKTLYRWVSVLSTDPACPFLLQDYKTRRLVPAAWVAYIRENL